MLRIEEYLIYIYIYIETHFVIGNHSGKLMSESQARLLGQRGEVEDKFGDMIRMSSIKLSNDPQPDAYKTQYHAIHELKESKNRSYIYI